MKRQNLPRHEAHTLLIHLPHLGEYCLIPADANCIPVGDLVACLCSDMTVAEQVAGYIIAQNRPVIRRPFAVHRRCRKSSHRRSA